jgi:hypothetical protein
VAAARGELPDSEKVSKAQMGAYFGAMTLRANCFPLPTRWSEAEGGGEAVTCSLQVPA